MQAQQKLSETVEKLRQQVREQKDTKAQKNIETVQVHPDWNKLEHNLGTIAPGSANKFSFTYKGTLKITKTSSSCGCTVSKSLPQPDGTVLIEATYNAPTDFSYSKTDLNAVHKNITITFEDNTTQVLTIRGQVDRRLNIAQETTTK